MTTTLQANGFELMVSREMWEQSRIPPHLMIGGPLWPEIARQRGVSEERLRGEYALIFTGTEPLFERPDMLVARFELVPGQAVP